MSVVISSPQGKFWRQSVVHLIGEVKNAYGFDADRLFTKVWLSAYLKFNIRVGHNWSLLSGKDTGETYEELKDETEECFCFDHPFDVHYKAKTMRGWPKFFLEVWQVDSDGRYSIAGYGTGVVPMTPGQRLLKVKCWRPKPLGMWKRLAAKLLNVQPELEFKDMAMSSGERFGQQTETTGTVEIDVGVIVKDFHLHGVNCYQEI